MYINSIEWFKMNKLINKLLELYVVYSSATLMYG